MKTSNAAPAYSRTTSPELGAALSVLGIDIRLDISVDRVSGKGWKTLLLGMDSVPWKEIGAETHADDPLPSHNTKATLGLLRNGKLQEADPHHPALDVLRACKAADSLAEWARRGDEFTLAKVKGAERWALVKAPLPLSHKTLPASFGTRSLKLAACLVVLGCPILRVEGQSPNALFFFAATGYGMPPPVVADLAQAYRSGRLAELTPEHPLLWMMQGLSNRDSIRDLMENKKPLVLIRAPGTGRASLVSSNVKGAAMDRVKRHLGIV